ncbi:protein phosphatase 2C-like protein [Clostridium sp. CAG:1193]|jgi:serine/threonine protein phosphatase PrpC|nr:protein phosphatase 2C-like protein [Clostridium sp. CAG:1193]
MKTFYLTDAGKVREHNEDNLIILKNSNDEYLLAVADGMGGHKAGEVASSIAIKYIEDNFKDSFGTKQDAINWLRESATNINDAIFAYTKEHVESKGMGTTLVASILTKEYLLFANIGDSSGFVVKDDKLFKVTKDHTLVNLLISTGELTEEAAKFHPKKNVLMKALGAVNPAEIDIFDVEKDVRSILLCSDGLTSMLNNEQIENVLNLNLTIEEKVTRLIRKSNNRGGVDNISIAYLEKESGEV